MVSAEGNDGVGVGFSAVFVGFGVVALGVDGEVVAARVGAEDLVAGDGREELFAGESLVFEQVVAADVAVAVVDADEAVVGEFDVGEVFLAEEGAVCGCEFAVADVVPIDCDHEGGGHGAVPRVVLFLLVDAL